VLVLGGGDGLALREVFKHPSVEAVMLVDIDPAMTGLSARYPPLAELNGHAFDNPRLQVVNQDAMIWLEEGGSLFDAVIIDFPDPHSYALGKLYTTRFYRLLQRRMTLEATLAIQCTSPLAARRSYWCIVRTLEAAGFHVKPYHTSLPAFGVWGFSLARRQPFEVPDRLPEGIACRYLTAAVLPTLFVFPADLGPVPVEINRLDNQVLVRYHETEWGRWD
jgi:spermidine synthase